jgi:hypothetical protein
MSDKDTISDLVGKKVINDIYEPLKNFLSRLSSDARVRWLIDNDQYIDICENFLRFKTIASNSEVLNLDDIYVPVKVRPSGNIRFLDTHVIIDKNQNFESESQLIIRGIAGKGKSTILKRLLANSIMKGKSIPIFFELKRFQGGELLEEIANFLKINGVNITKFDIESLIKFNKVDFFLDAFDEVNPDYRQKLLNSLRCLQRQNCRLILSTRPDTEIESLDLPIFDVEDLDQDQINQIIKKTCFDEEKSDSIISALSKSRLHTHQNGSILKTPILVALLCVSYNIGDDIPETLSQFYKNLFDTVFFRHDNIKGSVNRRRTFNDDKTIYLTIFEILALLNQKLDQHYFTRDDLIVRISKCLSYLNKADVAAEKIFYEITQITNLIFEDGFNRFRYAHRSIQEFFCASCIEKFDKDKKIDFYSKAMGDRKFYMAYEGVIFFLMDIDYINYMKFFYIPQVNRMLEADHLEINDNTEIPTTLITKFLNNLEFSISIYKPKGTYKDKNKEKKLELKNIILMEDDQSWAECNLFSSALQILVSQTEKLDLILLPLKMSELYVGSHYIKATEIYSDWNDSNTHHVRVIEEVLQLALYTEFRKKFNSGVKDILAREHTGEQEGIFEF